MQLILIGLGGRGASFASAEAVAVCLPNAAAVLQSASFPKLLTVSYNFNCQDHLVRRFPMQGLLIGTYRSHLCSPTTKE